MLIPVILNGGPKLDHLYEKVVVRIAKNLDDLGCLLTVWSELDRLQNLRTFASHKLGTANVGKREPTLAGALYLVDADVD